MRILNLILSVVPPVAFCMQSMQKATTQQQTKISIKIAFCSLLLKLCEEISNTT